MSNSISPITHAESTINFVRKRTNEIVLFYSGGGKDSLALLHMLTSKFDKVHCVFMYFVKDLEHQQPFLQLLKRYPNAVLHQYPHWNLSHFFANGEGLHAAYDCKKLKLKDIEDHIRFKTGCDWICYGWKQADGMTRRIILRTYDYESICIPTKKIFPLSRWKKNDVLFYNKQNSLPTPLQYNAVTNSQGLDLLPAPLTWLKEHFPRDFEKVCKQFPRAKAIVFQAEGSPKPEKVPRSSTRKVKSDNGKISSKDKKRIERNARKFIDQNQKAEGA